jgi:hypothetical protein
MAGHLLEYKPKELSLEPASLSSYRNMSVTTTEN